MYEREKEQASWCLALLKIILNEFYDVLDSLTLNFKIVKKSAKLKAAFL